MFTQSGQSRAKEVPLIGAIIATYWNAAAGGRPWLGWMSSLSTGCAWLMGLPASSRIY